MDLARLGNKYLADTEPWKVVKTDPNTCENHYELCLQITANLTIILAPFLPFIWINCGIPEHGRTELEQSGPYRFAGSGHQTNTPELLFEKIEDDVIEKQVTNYCIETKQTNVTQRPKLHPAKENCTFDDFQKMDIRTGTILEAERVPKTKKLMKLTSIPESTNAP